MKLFSKLFAGALSFVMLGSVVSGAYAQYYDDYTTDSTYSTDSYYDDTYDYDYEYSDEAAEAAGLFGAGLGIFSIILSCVLGVIVLADIIVRFISLIHCIQNAPDDSKTLWIVLIILVPFANWVYLFTKKKQWSKPKVATSTATPVKAE